MKDFGGSSEDERALLHAAKKMGYSFLSWKNNIVKVKINHHVQEYAIVAILPFEATRKMMSVVFCRPDEKYVIFTKGADTSILPRLKDSCDDIATAQMRSNQFAS